MELAHWTREVLQCAPEDVISSMPDKVVTNILNCLPIQDAIKTGIWCRNWRFKWTLLTQLVFDVNCYKWVGRFEGKSNFNVKNISKLILQLKQPITKFVLSIPYGIKYDVEDLHHCVLILSRKGIKELTLDNAVYNQDPLELPAQIYSCMELKELKLLGCSFCHSPSFDGFPNLLSLNLVDVSFHSFTGAELIARSPLLEILNISYYNNSSKVKFIDIAKLRNLRMLSLSWVAFDKAVDLIRSSSIFQLTSLPNLQKLTLGFKGCYVLADDGAKKVPTAFLYLKNLYISGVSYRTKSMISFIFDIICSSPNLQILEIMADDRYLFFEKLSEDSNYISTVCSFRLDCNTRRQLQLRNVVFGYFRGLDIEFHLIQFILSCSPLLQKMVIKLHKSCTKQVGRSYRYVVDLGLARKLANFHRASPAAIIDISEF